MRFIFDLAGTVIDSSHRQGDGSLDDWRRLNTVGNIMRDGLLPLAGKMQTAIQDGLDVWVCTSRVMGKADFAFLRMQSLLPNGGPVIHRISDADDRDCGDLKLAKLLDDLALLGHDNRPEIGDGLLDGGFGIHQKIMVSVHYAMLLRMNWLYCTGSTTRSPAFRMVS